MAKKQNTEEEIDVADYMEKLAAWAEKNAGKLVAGFLAFSVVVVAIWAVSAYKDRALNQAANSAGLVNRKIDLLEKAMLKVEDKDSAEFKQNKEAEIEKINTSVLDLIASHSDRSVTDFTTVKWASFLVKEEKQDKALEVLNSAKPTSTRKLSASILILKASLFKRELCYLLKAS
jgi:biopolymer transport protein ExbB/TolQ